MKFSYGVQAKVTIEGRRYDMYCNTSREVYDCLINHFDHDVAAEAEGWTEMACVGEWYDEDGFEIEMVEV